MLRHPYTSSLISCEQQKAWKYFNDYKKNINKITAKDVQKTAKKYLKQNYALVTIEQKDPSDQDKLAEKH
jgi:predicted Zn-dependent peptidase